MPYQQNYQSGYAQTYPCQEMARPVLETQPPPLVHFAIMEYPKLGMDLVPMQPYTIDLAYNWYDPKTMLGNVDGYRHKELQMEANLVMLVGQYP